MSKKTAQGAVEKKPRQSRKVGRPRKVAKPSKKAQEYLDGGYEILGDVVPTAAGFAEYLGVSRSRIYDWASEDAEFQDMLDAIQAKQERMLVNLGLVGTFNATIAKLMLAKHGYSEKSEVDNKSSDGSMTPQAPLDTSKLSPAAKEEILNAFDAEDSSRA